MDEQPKQQQPQPRGISIGFIISLLLVVGLIVLMATLLFGNFSSSTTLNEVQFVQALENNRVLVIEATPKEQTLMVLEGQYEYSVEGNIKKGKYYVAIPWDTYYDKDHQYTYTIESGDEKGKTVVTPAGSSIDNLIIDKVQEGARGITYKVKDPYVTSFWDQWGPTIIMMGASLLLVLFLFSRLSRSVGSSNQKALDFNRSRARKETNSKVKFDDVAGCDEEKAEMVELVSYLKEPKKYSKYGAKLPKGVLLVSPSGRKASSPRSSACSIHPTARSRPT